MIFSQPVLFIKFVGVFFQVVVALLSRSEKEEVQQLFDLLSESQSDQYSLEDLESLKKVYEL